MGNALRSPQDPASEAHPIPSGQEDPETGMGDTEDTENTGPSREEIRASVLLSIKNALGITPDQHPFDDQLIMHINTCFGTLHQLGIGPATPFTISGESEQWTDFIQQVNVEMVRTYVYLQTKLYFDAPNVSTLQDAMNRQIQELVWRLRVAGDEDHVNKFGEESEGGDDGSAYRSGIWETGI